MIWCTQVGSEGEREAVYLEFQGYLAEREQRVQERLREREADEDAGGDRHKVPHIRHFCFSSVV